MKTLLRTIQNLQPVQLQQIIYGMFMIIITLASLFAMYNLAIGNIPA